MTQISNRDAVFLFVFKLSRRRDMLGGGGGASGEDALVVLPSRAVGRLVVAEEHLAEAVALVRAPLADLLDAVGPDVLALAVHHAVVVVADVLGAVGVVPAIAFRLSARAVGSRGRGKKGEDMIPWPSLTLFAKVPS